MAWFVYVLQCADGTLYSGSTTDLPRRVDEHNGLIKGRGATYTKVRRPVQLVYSEDCTDRSTAGVREAELKKLTRIEKLELIKASSPRLNSTNH